MLNVPSQILTSSLLYNIIIQILALHTPSTRRKQNDEKTKEYIVKILKKKKLLICVCQVNGRVGIILMSDFLKASKAYWKQFHNGSREYADWRMDARTGNVIPVPDDKVFVFRKEAFNFEDSGDKNGFNAIIERCLAQRAVFDVPSIDDPNSGRKARKHFFNEK